MATSARKDVTIRLALKGGPEVERQFKRLGAEGNRALARVRAGTTPASRGLKALNATTGELRAGMTGAAARMGVLGSGLMALGPAGFAAAAGLGAAVLAIRAVMNRAGQAVQELDTLGDTAEKLGLSAEYLQEMRYAFEQNGVSAQTLEMALQRLSRRVGEIANFGKGEAKGALDELGVSIYGVEGRVKSMEALLPEIADALSGVTDQTRRLSLAQKLFDSEGVALITTLQQGSAALAAYQAEARELGLVVEEQFVRQAGEAADKLATIQRIIDAQLNQALVDLSGVLVTHAQHWATLAKWVGEVYDSFRDIEDMSTAGLRRELESLNQDLAGLETRRGEVSGAMHLQAIDEQIAAKRAEIAQLQAQVDARAVPSPKPPGANGSGLTGSSQTKKDPVGDYITQLNEKIQAQESEIRVMDKSAGAQARARAEIGLYNVLARENITLTDSQAHALEVSLDSLETATDRFNEMGEAQRLTAQRAQQFGDAWTGMARSVIFQTEDMSAAVRKFGMQIADIAITEAFLAPAGKAAGSFLASMFTFANGGVMTAQGPLPLRKYSDGGIANSPQLAMFGEGSVPEAYVPVPSGKIPVEMRGFGSAVVVKPIVYIKAPGVGARTEVTRGANGEVTIETVVEQLEDDLGRRMRRGEGLADVIENRYGLNPVGGRMT